MPGTGKITTCRISKTIYAGTANAPYAEINERIAEQDEKKPAIYGAKIAAARTHADARQNLTAVPKAFFACKRQINSENTQMISGTIAGK